MRPGRKPRGVTGSCGCKVGRAGREYGLDVDGALVRRWTGADGDRHGLRDLADHVNREVLAAALDDADVEVLDGEVANAYRLLAGDASSGQRAHARNRLARDGVDVEAVEDAFVSHQTVHAHLTECLDASYDGDGGRGESDGSEAGGVTDTVGALRSRAEAVTRDALDRRRADGLALGEFSVVVNVAVACDDCGRQYDVGSLLDQGGCDCREG